MRKTPGNTGKYLPPRFRRSRFFYRAISCAPKNFTVVKRTFAILALIRREFPFPSRGSVAEPAHGARRVQLARQGKSAERTFAGGRHQQIAGRDRVQPRWNDHHGEPEFPVHARLLARRNQGQASQHVRRAGSARQQRLPRILGQAQPRRVSGRAIQADRQGRQADMDSGVLQSDLRCQGQAIQGDQVRHRYHRAKDPEHGRRRQDRGDEPRPGRHRVQHGRHHRHGER